MDPISKRLYAKKHPILHAPFIRRSADGGQWFIFGVKVHCCVLDKGCWQDHRKYGMPMRLHVGSQFWTFPFLGANFKAKIMRLMYCRRGIHKPQQVWGRLSRRSQWFTWGSCAWCHKLLGEPQPK